MRGSPCDGSLKSLLNLALCHLPGNMEWKLPVQYSQQAGANIWSAHYNFLNRHFTPSTTKYGVAVSLETESLPDEVSVSYDAIIDQTTLSLYSVEFNCINHRQQFIFPAYLLSSGLCYCLKFDGLSLHSPFPPPLSGEALFVSDVNIRVGIVNISSSLLEMFQQHQLHFLHNNQTFFLNFNIRNHLASDSALC